MLDSENAIIEAIVKEQGLTEDDCLTGLTEQQVRVWLRYALLLETPEQIRKELFGHRKNPNDSLVMYTLAEASLRILTNILKDADLTYELQGKSRRKIRRVINKVEELRGKRGAKIKCRDRMQNSCKC